MTSNDVRERCANRRSALRAASAMLGPLPGDASLGDLARVRVLLIETAEGLLPWLNADLKDEL